MLSSAKATHADRYIDFPAFSSSWDDEDSAQCLYSSHALHPSVIYSSSSFLESNFWMAYSIFCISESDENPHLAVSNDNQHWQGYTSGYDTLTNPLISHTLFNATHLSDPELLLHNDTLWMLNRASWEIAGKDSHAVYISSTINGTSWSPQKKILSDGILNQANISSFVSPSLIANNDSSFSLFVVEPYANGITELDVSRVLRYTSLQPDSGWTLADTCLFYASDDSMKIWHIDILNISEDSLLALVIESPNSGLNFGDSAELYLAISSDFGDSWETSSKPVLSWVSDTAAWYGRLIYRSSGYWVEGSDNKILGLYYSALARNASYGGTNTGWQTGFTHVLFDSVSLPEIIDVRLGGQVDQGSIVDHQPQIEWNYHHPIEGLIQSQVEIEIGTDNNWEIAEMWNPPVYSSVDTFTLYNGLPLHDGESYFGRIRVANGIDWSHWYEFTFTMNSVPTVPVPLSPLQEDVTSNLPVLWISNSTDQEDNSLVYDFYGVKDTDTGATNTLLIEGYNIPEGEDSTSFLLQTSLDENAHYRWQVRAYDGFEYSAWSDLISANFWVNGDQELPSQPILLSPGSFSSPLHDSLPVFYWEESHDPDPFNWVYYKLYIGLDSSFNDYIVVDSITTNSFQLINPLALDLQYWWKIEARDNTGLSCVSNSMSFLTSCCIGLRGNINNDDLDQIDISDFVYFIEYFFNGGVKPSCTDEADMNVSGYVDITDIVYILDFMFRGGPAPAACDSDLGG